MKPTRERKRISASHAEKKHRARPEESRRLVADLVAADTSTMVYDGIPLSLMPSPTDPDSYTVHVDGRGLTWSPATEAQPRHTDLILMVSTFDSKGIRIT